MAFLRIADRIDYCLQQGATPDSPAGASLLTEGALEYAMSASKTSCDTGRR